MQRQTKNLMGMPITVEVVDAAVSVSDLAEVFDYFAYVDQKFSTYKSDSEISRINRGEIAPQNFSADMREVLALAEQTKKITGGYFDIRTPAGVLDPSGLVKGWAIHNAAGLLTKKGFRNFYVEAGGDIQVCGHNSQGRPWRVGIRNPFTQDKQVIKAVQLKDLGIATSGSYLRGRHIYNPKAPAREIKDIVSLTVIGPNVYEADRLATAAFAMGRAGINFIESLKDFAGYMVDSGGIATETANFERHTLVYA